MNFCLHASSGAFFIARGGNMEKTKPIKRNWVEKWFGRMLTVRGITEMAMLVALGIVLDRPFLKISFSEGVSLSLTMVPLFIIALRFPVVDSFLGIGVVYGFTTLLLDGYRFESYPLDYLLAYGSIAIASFFRFFIFNRNNKIYMRYTVLVLSVFLSVSVRILWSTINGLLIYESPSFLASFLYNAPAMAASAVLVAIVLFLLFPTLERFNPQIYLSGFNKRK